jgi:hypothetical protein
MPTLADFTNEMNLTAVSVHKLIAAGRRAGLSHEAAVVAVLVGVLSDIRVDELNEDALLNEARRAVPKRNKWDGIAIRSG